MCLTQDYISWQAGTEKEALKTAFTSSIKPLYSSFLLVVMSLVLSGMKAVPKTIPVNRTSDLITLEMIK